MGRMDRIVLGVRCLVIPFIHVASGQAFEFELGFTEVDEQSYLDASRVQSQLPVQQLLLLFILFILSIDVP